MPGSGQYLESCRGIEPPPRVLPCGLDLRKELVVFLRRRDDEMVHIDCCCFRAVYDERCSRSQAMRVLCPRPDDLLQASQGQVLQGTESEVLQVQLQQRLWQELRQQLRLDLCSVLCGSRRMCSELCRSGCRLRSGRCPQLCCSRCLRSGRCPELCRSGCRLRSGLCSLLCCSRRDLRFGLQQRLQQRLWQVMLPQAQVLQGSEVLQGPQGQVLQGSQSQVLQEPLQPRLRPQLWLDLCPQLCSSRQLCRSGQLCSSGSRRCLVWKDCHQVMATAT